MKLEEFYQNLSETSNHFGTEWTASPHSTIRLINPSRYHCPITAVCEMVTGKNFLVNQVRKASAALRLHHDIESMLVLNADNAIPSPMRDDLLKYTKAQNDQN